MTGRPKALLGPGVALAFVLALWVFVAALIAWVIGQAPAALLGVSVAFGVALLLTGAAVDTWQRDRARR